MTQILSKSVTVFGKVPFCFVLMSLKLLASYFSNILRISGITVQALLLDL
jgi:hypothetical protein